MGGKYRTISFDRDAVYCNARVHSSSPRWQLRDRLQRWRIRSGRRSASVPAPFRLCLGERGGRVGRAHEEEVDLLPVPTWAKAAKIGDLGTGCRRQNALPRVSGRLGRSSGVRGAARSPARPPQAAAQLCQRELWHYRDGTLAMLPVRARARRLAALVDERRAKGALQGREAVDLSGLGVGFRVRVRVRV